MFTGIITDIGEITSIEKIQDTRFVIKTNFDTGEVTIGASVACSGCCLTVVEKTASTLSFDVSDESLACTNLGALKTGNKINLEQALKMGDELGGHIVSGHVDGLAEVLSIEEIGGSHKTTFKAPENLKLFIAAKGSVTLDGVSLTVNDVNDSEFSVNIIPHTWENTTFNGLYAGSQVNLEIDVLARYVARMTEKN